MPQNVASDQGLHCLLLIQQFSNASDSQNGLNQILGQEWLGVKVT